MPNILFLIMFDCIFNLITKPPATGFNPKTAPEYVLADLMEFL